MNDTNTPACTHPSWSQVGDGTGANAGKFACGVCGAIGREMRYLSVDGAHAAPAPQAENAALRRMLACRVAGASLYMDDGELQDNTVQPFIDFRRDSVEEIERKLIDRGIATFAKEASEALAAGRFQFTSAGGWISVGERLPQKFDEVLVAFEGITIPSTGQYTGNPRDRHGWCYPIENNGMCDDGSDPVVTHWMPLPAAPGGIQAPSVTDEIQRAVLAERERCAALVESRAGMHGTGAWTALIAAADAIRAPEGKQP